MHHHRQTPNPLLPVVYVHIPKAAGTSLKDILARVYKSRPLLFFTAAGGELERFRTLPSGQRRRVAVLAGHEPFGYQSLFHNCGVTPSVITVLREPVARVVSLFRYIHREPDHPRHAEFVRRRTTIADVFARGELPAFDNHQVRYLAGRAAFETPVGRLTSDHLEQAKRHLSTGCRAFGLQERFEESIAWFSRELRWPETATVGLNISKGPAHAPEISGSDRARIARHNELDADLYEFASKLFSERAGC